MPSGSAKRVMTRRTVRASAPSPQTQRGTSNTSRCTWLSGESKRTPLPAAKTARTTGSKLLPQHAVAREAREKSHAAPPILRDVRLVAERPELAIGSHHDVISLDPTGVRQIPQRRCKGVERGSSVSVAGRTDGAEPKARVTVEQRHARTHLVSTFASREALATAACTARTGRGAFGVRILARGRLAREHRGIEVHKSPTLARVVQQSHRRLVLDQGARLVDKKGSRAATTDAGMDLNRAAA